METPVSLHYELEGDGEPVLLLHGFTGSGSDWDQLKGGLGSGFQFVIPDLRGHGRSGVLSRPFRHRDAAEDVRALLDSLAIKSFRGVGISGGGNVLLHLSVQQPERVRAMVLVSATSHFPEQARSIMRQYAGSPSAEHRAFLERSHPGGEAQIDALLASTRAFAESRDDMNLTRDDLSRIQARTLIVQGDRDPFYPVEISVEMARSIPHSSLWVLPGSGHAPVFDEWRAEFLRVAAAFLR